MSKEYLEKLKLLNRNLKLDEEIKHPIEIKHFFSGAALYINGIICVSCSPVGLAFNLPETEVETLIKSGQGKPLKYFPKGHIKKGYILFEQPDYDELRKWKKYFVKAANCLG